MLTIPPVVVDDAATAIDAHKVYGDGTSQVRALDGVTVGFGRGRFTAIMGPSGSGKSTLMHCLAGLDTLSSGSVLIDGEDVSAMNDRERTMLRRDKLGFVFQAFNLVPTLTAKENITLPKRLAGGQIFSIDSLASGLRQLTNFGEVADATSGCNFTLPRSGCGVSTTFFDAVTHDVVFYSSCDPFGTGTSNGQLFAMRSDGRRLRQLTRTRGLVIDTDGTVTAELPGPFWYPGGTT